jgi:hypothetical protein
MGVLVRVVPTVTVDTRCASAKRERFPDGALAGGETGAARCGGNRGCGGSDVFWGGTGTKEIGTPCRGRADLRCASLRSSHRKGPEHGWRGGGPLCPLRWMIKRENRCHGPPNNMNRPKRDVSPPLLFPAPLSRPPAARTSVSARWANLRRSATEWAAQQPGSAMSGSSIRRTLTGFLADGNHSGAHANGLLTIRSQRADTEGRAPAALLLGPFERCLGLGVERDFRYKPFSCPWERFACDPNPAERTRRSALPPPAF